MTPVAWNGLTNNISHNKISEKSLLKYDKKSTKVFTTEKQNNEHWQFFWSFLHALKLTTIIKTIIRTKITTLQNTTQLILTCSKSEIELLEKGSKHVPS